MSFSPKGDKNIFCLIIALINIFLRIVACYAVRENSFSGLGSLYIQTDFSASQLRVLT